MANVEYDNLSSNAGIQSSVLKKHWWKIALTAAIFVLPSVILQCRSQTPHNNASEGKLRIISLAPNLTEILFALDLQDCIVGVTNCCDYPSETKDIEYVGGFGKPNIEKVLTLHPDLIIATDFEDDSVAELLSKSGIRLLHLRIHNFQELFEALREIGQATGTLQRAEKMVETMQMALEKIAERFKKVKPWQRPKVFVEIWHDPITTVGQASFINEVITRAGGVNVAGNIKQAYPHVNPEKVIEWNPDVIVLCYMQRDGYSASQLANRIGWDGISAIREGRIIEDIQPDLISRPGPRLIEGVKILAQRLYGAETGKYVVDDINE